MKREIMVERRILAAFILRVLERYTASAWSMSSPGGRNTASTSNTRSIGPPNPWEYWQYPQPISKYLSTLSFRSHETEILRVDQVSDVFFSRKYFLLLPGTGSIYAILPCKTKRSSDHKNARLGSFSRFYDRLLRNSDANLDGVSSRNFATIPKIKIPFTGSIYVHTHAQKVASTWTPSRIFPLIRTFLQKIDQSANCEREWGQQDHHRYMIETFVRSAYYEARTLL